jgi:uncharacterized protein (DUF924 family)
MMGEETPAQAVEILRFWFEDALEDPEAAAARNAAWFGVDPEFDRCVRERYGALIEAALAGRLGGWSETPRGALALVLLLDQFTRNVHRGTARAFAGDSRALGTARGQIDAGHDRELAEVERLFLYLPFTHSEEPADQERAVELMETLVGEARPPLDEFFASSARYAREHQALIERFGRFPHRNRALGRVSTPEEEAYLTAGGATFGQ